jgi:hypothetical protein
VATIASSESCEAPRVSVVVCTRDRPRRVRETIRLLRKQAGAPQFEIWVVDDGSEPALVLDELVGAPATRVTRIPRVGRSAARNHGSEMARGSILTFVDDDMNVGPQFIAEHERAHRRWSNAIVVGSQILPEHARETPLGRFRRRLEEQDVPAAGVVVDRPNFCTAANMSIPRQLLAELGGFNPQLDCGEDQDLALRHSTRGHPIVFLPEASAVHDDLALDIRSYSRKVEWTGENLTRFCRAQPAWPANVERLRVNGPPLLGREPVFATARKFGKALLGEPALVETLFRLTAVVERTFSDGWLLDTLYRILVGIHIQRGFRRGLDGSGWRLA